MHVRQRMLVAPLNWEYLEEQASDPVQQRLNDGRHVEGVSSSNSPYDCAIISSSGNGEECLFDPG